MKHPQWQPLSPSARHSRHLSYGYITVSTVWGIDIVLPCVHRLYMWSAGRRDDLQNAAPSASCLRVRARAVWPLGLFGKSLTVTAGALLRRHRLVVTLLLLLPLSFSLYTRYIVWYIWYMIFQNGISKHAKKSYQFTSTVHVSENKMEREREGGRGN